MLGCYGIVLVGAFELDPFSKPMVVMHYIGVIFFCFTMFGFLYQAHQIGDRTNYDDIWRIIFGWILLVSGTVFATLWITNANKSKEFASNKNGQRDNLSQQEIAKKITRFTLLSILFEGLCLFSGALSISFWLISYQRCRALGCY